MGTPELRVIKGDGAPPNPRAAPTVFVRTLSSPPGAPWDQVRSVALEARIGAPLPVHELYIEQRRLGAWALGRPARFAVCYARRAEIVGEHRTEVEADGRRISVTFRAPAARRGALTRLALLAAGAAGIAVLSAGAISAALDLRAQTEDELATVEQQAASRLHQAQVQARLSAQARLLNAAGAGHQTVDTLLGDLAWAAAAKAPDAHIDALHWEQGYLGVETRGGAAPFVATDRPVIRADRMLRPGVWLWGVGPRGAGGSGGGAR